MTSAGLGPNAACSRNRIAAETGTTGFCTPTGIGMGCELAGVIPPLLTTTLTLVPCCGTVVTPVAVNCVGETYVVVSATPPRLTFEVLLKSEPLTVNEYGPNGSNAGARL